MLVTLRVKGLGDAYKREGGSVCNDSYINSGICIKQHRYTVGGRCVDHCNFYLF